MKLLRTIQMIHIITASLLCQVFAGNLDSPGTAIQGSNMYSLIQTYDYLLYGTSLSVHSGFQMPLSAPSPTMKTLREIGDDIKALFDQCSAFPVDVKAGKKFFCTQSGMWGVQMGVATTGSGNLIKTGQVPVYYPGDDGTYQKGIDFNYVDNGDGTVTDNATGLVWASDGNGIGCASGAMLTWAQAVDWANTLVFAGYYDWRLPNVRELETLLNSGVYAPALDSYFFTNTRSGLNDYYWSSTTYDYVILFAWHIRFHNGNIEPASKGEYNYVRVVRGGQ